MARNKMEIKLQGMEEYIRKLSSVEGAVQKATNAALAKSQELIAEQVTAAMETHNKTGATSARIIRGNPVEWTGSTAKIAVGFDIGETDGKKKNDRLASIFLMYGTKIHGQPHEKPDRNLYNAVYGKATKAKIKEIQKAAFENAIREVFK